MTNQEFIESLKGCCKTFMSWFFWFIFGVFYLIAFAALYNLVRG